MQRLLPTLFCLLLLAACDSGEDPPGDSSLFSVAVETPSGEPVSGLSVAMEYGFGGEGGGDRPAAFVPLRYFTVDALAIGRYRVEWEAEDEKGLARYVLEGEPANRAFEEVTRVEPEGAGIAYSVEAEGRRYSAFRLRFVNTDGSVDYSDIVEVVGEADPVGGVRLSGNYPNPFGGQTTISFELPVAVSVTLDIVDLEGQPVVTLIDGTFASGQHDARWEPNANLAGGFYRVRLTTADTTLTRTTVYAGADYSFDAPLRVVTALGTTGGDGRFATDDRSRFPQRYDVEAEFRDENNNQLGTIRPSDAITIVLRDADGREQRYDRTLGGGGNGFTLTWDPQ